MILDVQPVANIAAVTVHRQGPAAQDIGKTQRDQLFREVVRAVIIRAIAGAHLQTVGVMVGAHQVI